MRKKNNLFKNIFYVFFAFCFLSAGAFALGISNKNALAENTQSVEIGNSSLPEYFSYKEFDNGQPVPSSQSLISSNIFLYSQNKTLKLSLDVKNILQEQYSSVYDYVYYPDEQNTKVFYFYNIYGIGLSVNGQRRDDLVANDFVTNTGVYFTNKPDTELQTFEMTFAGSKNTNEIAVTDTNGVVEGVYTITLDYILFECTDGKNDGTEDISSITSDVKGLTFSFYVVDSTKYMTNNIPNVTTTNFDHKINSPSTVYDFYLYSNYTSRGQANKIPYIEYDYTRYDVEITKELGANTNSQSLLYDVDNQTVTLSGDDIAYYSLKENNKIRVYFNDLGNYTISYSDILLVDFLNGEENELQKHSLSAIENKKMLVYVYGYQANYTDADSSVDSNGSKMVKELKVFDYENDKYLTSDEDSFKNADITSEFLNSDPNFDINSSTFTISNIASFIGGKDAVVTNQTPIKFTANASLSNASVGSTGNIASYIYSTKQISANYVNTGVKLNGQDLYGTRFNGQAEGSVGKYIYLVAYTFNNYYETTSTPRRDQIFYQIFYFEISKQLPSIEVKTVALDDEEATNIYSGIYTNHSVNVVDTTNDNPYNRKVQIRIYAQEKKNGNYLSSFNGVNGVNFYDKSLGNDNLILSENAYYTIRLYNDSEVTSSNIAHTSKSGYFREQYFTIDKTPISGISATNVSEILNSTNYKVVSSVTTLSTNQNIALSWNEKTSGAKTRAYYRYFKLESFNYYGTNPAYIHSAINNMLNQTATTSYLPINYTLDMNTTNNKWFEYKGNAKTFIDQGEVSSEYVFSDEGLYLVDVYDEAGNHAIEAFLIDYSTPVIALYNVEENLYSIGTGSAYISSETRMHWAKYKSVYINNFTELSSVFETGTISSDKLENAFFKDYNGNACREIYEKLYEKFKQNNYLQILQNSNTPDQSSDLYNKGTYTGLYLTVPINDTYYFLNTTTNDYDEKSGKDNETILSEIIAGEDNEKVYRVIIRDNSNTKYVDNFPQNSAIQYKQYYSATQKLTVSFDSSNFRISYKYQSGASEVTETLDSNNGVIGQTEIIEGTTPKTVAAKTTYLSPTKMDTVFYMSFVPTKIEGDSKIQVDRISLRYYAYQKKTEGENTYYTLSENSTETIIYEYTGENQTETLNETIRINQSGKTSEGKYEITRIYRTGTGFDYNENDYYSRTFVLIVDRNGVITNPDLVSNGDQSHLESLVGGDIFVAMYDNKTNVDYVITFPDSVEGNKKGSSLYNNGTARTVFTTNKLPVNVYIPKYKYTKFASLQSEQGSYHFEVTGNGAVNVYDENFSGQTSSFNPTSIIPEYVLYAEIYKGDTLIAKSQNSDTTTAQNVSSEYEFLRFYTPAGGNFTGLTQAGEYYVKIYQGTWGDGLGENSFYQSSVFKFEIEKASPDFIVTSESSAELNKIIPSDSSDVAEIYYTNSSNVKISWNAGSDYLAEIDQNEIVMFVNGSRTATKVVNDGTYIQSWTQPELSNGIYTSTINLQTLGIYNNGGYVDIRMQFINHDGNLYDTIKKRIVVDLSAPSANITNLVSKAIGERSVYGLKTQSLRTYNTANNEITTNLENTSYNISNATGNFAYYSYFVTENFLTTLQNSQEYITYARLFEDVNGQSTKYLPNTEQETSPATFLASNFTKIDNVTFKANSYYEIVELDRAGNMAIYTIFVTSYDPQTDEFNNLFTYTAPKDEGETTEGEEATNSYNYTIDDYVLTKSYSGAVNNIYSKVGMELEGINYFGDAWAQFTLKTYSASGIPTINYLMLTPWDKTHAYSYSNGTATAYEISSLINGSLNSRFKNSFAFYNRQSGTNDYFYFNTRSIDLVANLNDSSETSDTEYIYFDVPTDGSINSDTYASLYLTKIKISTSDIILYEKENKLGFASLWTSNENYTATHNQVAGRITFQLNPSLNLPTNTKIIYEYTSNYGKSYKEIHLYKEAKIKNPVGSENDLYAFYTASGTFHYITQNGFQYLYNPNKYRVEVYKYIDNEKSEAEYDGYTVTTTSNEIKLITIYASEDNFYNETYVIEIYDVSSDEFVNSVFVVLYDELPMPSDSTIAVDNQSFFKLYDANKNNVTDRIINTLSSDETGYFSEITLIYSVADTFIPIKYSYSTDKTNWTEVASGTKFTNTSETLQKYYIRIWYDTEYIRNNYTYSSADYIFQNIPNSQIFEFNLSSLTSTFWVEKTIGGVTTIVERTNTVFKIDGRQYSNHYIVNLNFDTDEDAVTIKTNKEQGISAEKVGGPTYKGNATSQLWKISNESQASQNVSLFTTYIVITYIPNSSNFVSKFYSYNSSGVIDTSDNLISKTSKQFIVYEEGSSSINRVKLQWSKDYGIEENEINISIYKDGVKMDATVYTENDYKYCYLTYSGRYVISLFDTAGNVQKFSYGSAGQSDTFTYIFLKDVAFTVTYTNPETQMEETSLPNKQAVYNGRVSLNIDNSTRSIFYSAGYPIIAGTRNGVALTENDYTTAVEGGKTKYIFTKSGSYEITFSAESKTDGKKIRSESYQFTILNAYEHRYSYILNKYSNYYIEKVQKNGVDITERLVSTLNKGISVINNKKYLTELALSYLDEKTGEGTYLITVNSNVKDLSSESLPSKWTFQVIIKSGSAPVSVSLKEGQSSVDAVTVTFNKTNVYQEMGECVLRIIKYTRDGKYSGVFYTININSSTTGKETVTIPRGEYGNFYVQISSSDNLLYSYRVSKTEPMNAASIIAIVGSVVLVVVIIIIVVRLRKRIAVK